LVGTARDITERKVSEKALDESRKELQAIYDNAPVMLCVIDKDHRIDFANEAFTNLVGYEESEIMGGLLGGVVGCINSLDDPRGCGFGPKCAACTLKNAIDKSFKYQDGQHNIEYQTTINLKGELKDISLLGSTALIETNGQQKLLLSLHNITDRKAAEDALQKSETLLRTFIDNFPFEIWARDINSIGILENRKFIEHFGSIIGIKPVDDTRVDKETIKLWQNINKRVFAGETLDEEYEFEVGGKMRHYQQIVFPIKDAEKINGIAGFNIDITARKLAEKALSESQEMLQNFAAHLQNVREEERVLLAREIHDELGQILVAVKIDLGMLKQNVIKSIKKENVTEILEKFDNVVNLVDNTIKTARKIMTDLRPEVLELLGFTEAVKLHFKNFGERYHVKTEFINTFDNMNIDPQQEIALFRIIQEALNNVAKHAKASKVKIEFKLNSGKLILTIQDNGIGIDDTKGKKADSYGLIGMKERVFLLGGDLTIQGEKNKGTIVRIEMPHKLMPEV
jgi:PAS domain S-box-containing protein